MFGQTVIAVLLARF